MAEQKKTKTPYGLEEYEPDPPASGVTKASLAIAPTSTYSGTSAPNAPPTPLSDAGVTNKVTTVEGVNDLNAKNATLGISQSAGVMPGALGTTKHP